MAATAYALLLATAAMAALICFTPLPTSAMDPPLSPHPPSRSSSSAPSPSPSEPYPPWRRGEKGFNPLELYLFFPPYPYDLWVGVMHRWASLRCQANEAAFLRRILVLDQSLHVPGRHNGGVREERPLELYFDLPYLRQMEEIFERIQLGDSSNSLGEQYLGFESKHSHRCEARILGLGELIELVEPIRYAAPLLEMAETILLDLPNDTVGLHVRRGDKLKLIGKYPHLQNDTQPAHIMEVLRAREILKGRMIYIATNEREEFFEPLSAEYELRFISHYSSLWAPSSSWWNSTQESLGGRGAPKFDGAMKGIVDYSIMDGLQIRLETFNDLTPDPK